jgi:hypothetical protein
VRSTTLQTNGDAGKFYAEFLRTGIALLRIGIKDVTTSLTVTNVGSFQVLVNGNIETTLASSAVSEVRKVDGLSSERVMRERKGMVSGITVCGTRCQRRSCDRRQRHRCFIRGYTSRPLVYRRQPQAGAIPHRASRLHIRPIRHSGGEPLPSPTPGLARDTRPPMT